MNLTLAITLHRAALLRLVAMVFAASGLGERTKLPRIIRGTVLYYLRPMESAVRRLIFAKAQGLTLKPRAKRAAPTRPIPRGNPSADHVPAFPLFDPRKRLGTGVGRSRYAKGPGPRIGFFDGSDPARPEAVEAAQPDPDGLVDAAGLCRRLQSLKAALEDMPKQAKRMARAMARRAMSPPGLRRVPPLRPGRPPGHRARGRDEVDDILRECHQIALWAPSAPDTS